MVSRLSLACVVFSLFLISSCLPCQAQLSSNFYDSTCPNALTTIRTAIRRAVSSERRMAASLIRLHFHDCFVQVDYSIATTLVLYIQIYFNLELIYIYMVACIAGL